MSVLSEALGNHGVPHTLTHAGKTYCARLLDQVTLDEFQKYLFGRVKAVAREMRDLMDADKYEKHLLEINNCFVLGQYTLESPNGLAFINTTAGRIYLAQLILGATYAEVVLLVTQVGAEVGALLRLVLAESFPGLSFEKAQGEPDPNVQRPALT